MNHRVTRRTLVVVAALATVCPSVAAAQDSYQPYVLGLRTAGMGGTAVALGRDSASPWLNPAGVAAAGGTLALSANAALVRLERAPEFYSLEPNSALQPSGGTTSERSSTEFTVFPSSVLIALPIGKHVVGLSLVTPFQLARSQFTTFGIDLGGGGSFDSLDVDQGELRFNNYGLVYGYDFGLVRAGVSLYVRQSILRLASDGRSIVFLPSVNEIEYNPTSTTQAADSYDFDAVAGIQVGPMSGFSVGLTVQAPSIHLAGSWDRSQTTYEASSATGVISLRDFEMRDGEYEVRLPLTFRVGLGYEDPDHFAVAVDTSIHLPVSSYSQLSGTQIQRTLSNEPTMLQLPAPTDISVEVERELTVNVNVGGEWWWSKRFALRGGFFTDFSNRPELPTVSARTLADVGSTRIDRFGGTLGVGYKSDYTQFQLAFAYLGGLGTIVGLEFADNGDNRFVDIDYGVNSFMLVFSGELDPVAVSDAVVRAAIESSSHDPEE